MRTNIKDQGQLYSFLNRVYGTLDHLTGYIPYAGEEFRAVIEIMDEVEDAMKQLNAGSPINAFIRFEATPNFRYRELDLDVLDAPIGTDALGFATYYGEDWDS